MNIEKCVKLLPKELEYLESFVLKYVPTQRDPLRESDPEASDSLDVLVDRLVRNRNDLRLLRAFFHQHQSQFPAEIQAIKDFIRRIMPSPA